MPIQGQRVGYIRVSTAEQATDRQLLAQNLDRTFEDRISGKSVDRPQLQAMMNFVREGDTVLVHSMDRLARNLDDLRRLVQTLTKRGITVTFVKEGLTFTGEDSPMATLTLSLLGAFAEFERSLILERQKEGIAIAKTKGVYKGRKPSLTQDQITNLRSRVEAGEAKADLAKEFNICRQTLYNCLRVPASGKGLPKPSWVEERN